MNFIHVFFLAIIQGIAELLPVSSSAHVIFAEKLMGLNPTAPEMTFLLVMLHTGTMFAVIVYFWQAWEKAYFSSWEAFWNITKFTFFATAATGVVGITLLKILQHIFAGGETPFEVEQLFDNPYIISTGLAASGILILLSSRFKETKDGQLSTFRAIIIGAVQGLCLPFRGFSRSGATISTGILLGTNRIRAEEFSFALAVVLTPVVIAKEFLRMYKAHALVLADSPASVGLQHFIVPSLFGMVISFLAGFLALRWLSRWLEQDRWHFFGIYCLAFSAVVFITR
jgi:undecaprenyl-diphosphatase